MSKADKYSSDNRNLYDGINKEETKQERKRNASREFFFSLLFLILTNLAFGILYAVFLDSYVTAQAHFDYDKSAQVAVMIFSSVMFVIMFGVWYFIFSKKSEEKRRLLNTAISSGEQFSFANYYKNTLLRFLLPSGLAFAIFMIPFSIFYAIWGYGYAVSISFENYFAGQMLFYELTKSAIAAYLINLALFCANYAICIYLILKRWYAGRIRTK